jgi:hypothetical protein
MKKGFVVVSRLVKDSMSLIRQCKYVNLDFNKMMKIADVCEHPMTLVFYPSQRLLLDGIDIFKRMVWSMDSYKIGDKYKVGKYFGSALNEVVLKSPYVKKPKDEHAYEFLTGFFHNIPQLKDKVNAMYLFNRILDMGNMIFGPVEATI